MSTHWNYRVLAHKDDDENVYFEIHEVYYRNNEPKSYTAKSISIWGESIIDIELTLEKIKQCLDEPILSEENFPQEYKE